MSSNMLCLMYIIISVLFLSSAQVHVAEKQSAQARQVTQGVEEAKSDNLQFQAQLLKAGQALHSQQQFVMTLQAAADEAAQGESDEHDACNAGFDSLSFWCCCLRVRKLTCPFVYKPAAT